MEQVIRMGEHETLLNRHVALKVLPGILMFGWRDSLCSSVSFKPMPRAPWGDDRPTGRATLFLCDVISRCNSCADCWSNTCDVRAIQT